MRRLSRWVSRLRYKLTFSWLLLVLLLLCILLWGHLRSLCALLLTHLFKELNGLLVQLLVSLDHQLLKREEVVHSHDLIDYLLVHRVLLCLLTGLQELLVGHSKLIHQLLKQVFDYFFEVLDTSFVLKQDCHLHYGSW